MNKQCLLLKQVYSDLLCSMFTKKFFKKASALQSGFSREIDHYNRQTDTQIYPRWILIYAYKEFVFMIIDVPKFTAGDPGEPEIYFQSESEGLRIRRAYVVSSVPRAGKDGCPSAGRQAGKVHSCPVFLFYSELQLIG